MYRLFDRIIELKIGETNVTELDVAFEIQKDLSPEPNSCHIDIYNLCAKNREVISRQKRVPVLLRAGYKDHVGLIFKGDLISCTYIKEGPTWKTTLASGDGVAAMQNARINKSFVKDTPVKKVIEELAKQLGLPANSALKQLETLMDKLPRGFSVSGSAFDNLSNILKRHGYNAHIQDSTLQILKNEEVTTQKVIHLSSNSGLIATPQIGSNKMIDIQTVLMPEIQPGVTINIKSSNFSGHVKVKKTRSTANNFGSDWRVDALCRTV